MSNNIAEHFDESARSTVSQSETVSGWSLGLVLVGICLTLPSLYTGANAAQHLGVIGTAKAVGLASGVLACMSIPAAIVGARTRLSSYMIIRFVFGLKGSNYVNALLAFTLLGWFAVTAGFFGQTLFIAVTEIFGSSPPVWLLTLLSSLLILITTLFGFKAMDKLATFAVPMLVIFLLYVSYLSLQTVPAQELIMRPATNPDYFPTAVATIIGSLIVGVVLMPDLSRYARSTRDCYTASIFGNGLGNSFSMLISVFPAMVTGLLDPMAFMIAMGVLGSAFFILVFATWTTNAINLYSTSLATAVITPKTAEWKLMVACCAIGVGLAMAGIADYFITFLEWLGVIVPPIAGIYLTDYFILKRKDFNLQLLDKVENYATAAIIAWLTATAISVVAFMLHFSVTGIESLDALLLTIPLYLICDKVWPVRYAREEASPS
ncbi:MAG: cytosine permease [Halieaceae bacterium]